MQTSPADRPEGGGLRSVLFWLCLLAATGLYAPVALAPKVVAWLELRHEYRDAQIRLVAMERQVIELQRVTTSLESDPRFATQLARIEFHAARPGEERIPVDPGLSLGRSGIILMPAERRSNETRGEALAGVLSSNSQMRAGLLASSAVCVLFAFTFLSVPAAAGSSASGARIRPSGWLGRRYAKPE